MDKPLSVLGETPSITKRFAIYRRMARSRLSDLVEHSFPRLSSVLSEHMTPLIERWLDEEPPRSPYFRDVAIEFGNWLRQDVLPAEAPPWTLELARHETAALEVENAETQTSVEVDETFSFERPAVLTQAHRILRAQYGVHRLPVTHCSGSERDVLVEQGPFALCLYRDETSYEVRVLELSPIAAAILEEVRLGDRPVVEAVRAAAARESFEIDGPLVAGFSDLVSDLAQRGVWLGCKPIG